MRNSFDFTNNNDYKKPHESIWEKLNWSPNSKQIDQFISLQKLLNDFNETVNLTRLLKGEDYWIGQVLDSLLPLKTELQSPFRSLSCVDIGSGCGFPGLAVAIAFPQAKVTLIDAVYKKTAALKKITNALNLAERVKIYTERAELTGQREDSRGTFHLAIARAVASPPITAEYLIPLIRLDGEALLFRGKWSQADETNLIAALVPLKARIKKTEGLTLPGNRGVRTVIRLEAMSPCPRAYPRAVGIPTKRPLGS